MAEDQGRGNNVTEVIVEFSGKEAIFHLSEPDEKGYRRVIAACALGRERFAVNERVILADTPRGSQIRPTH